MKLSKCKVQPQVDYFDTSKNYLIEQEQPSVEIWYSDEEQEGVKREQSFNGISIDFDEAFQDIKVKEQEEMGDSLIGDFSGNNQQRNINRFQDDQEYSVSEETSAASIQVQEYENESDVFAIERGSRQEKRSTNRKRRTTITQQTLTEMNRIFSEYIEARKLSNVVPQLNLKLIGKKLQLGYSTILHKFKQYKDNNHVKGGYLLEIGNQKRKYKKSVEVEELIKEALKQTKLANAVQISRYIYKTKNKYYSRAVICRHLLSMDRQQGIIKKINPNYPFKVVKTIVPIKDIILNEIKKGNVTFCNQSVFTTKDLPDKIKNFSQIARFNKNKACQFSCISVFLAINNNSLLHFKVKRGILTRDQYVNELEIICSKMTQKRYNTEQKPILGVNINQLHYEDQQQQTQSVQKVIQKYNVIKVALTQDFQPTSLNELHESIQKQLPHESSNRQAMKRLVEKVIKEWASGLDKIKF